MQTPRWRTWLAVLAIALTYLLPDLVYASAPVLLGTTTLVTDVDEIMKVMFEDSVEESYVADSEVIEIIDSYQISEKDTTGGRWIEMGHMLSLPAGSRAVLENDYIPVPEPATFINSRVYLKKRMATIEMTGDVMDRVRGGNEEVFLNYMERAMPGLLERLGADRDVAYVGYGLGVKARVLAVTGPASGLYTITLQNNYGITGFTGAWKSFMEGETIVFAAAATNPTLRNAGTAQAFKVTEVVEAGPGLNGSIIGTMDAALAAAIVANDYIFQGDQSGHSGQTSGENRELTGLIGMVDDGGVLATYMNQPRTVSRFWRSLVYDAQASGNGVLDEDLLNLIDDSAGERRNSKLNALLTSRSAARGYWKSVKTERWQQNPRHLVAGKDKVDLLVNGRLIPFRTARKLPDECAFFIESATIKRVHLGRGKWDDTTGAIWNRVTDGTGRKHAFYASYIMREELCCKAPGKNVAIRNILPTST